MHCAALYPPHQLEQMRGDNACLSLGDTEPNIARDNCHVNGGETWSALPNSQTQASRISPARTTHLQFAAAAYTPSATSPLVHQVHNLHRTAPELAHDVLCASSQRTSFVGMQEPESTYSGRASHRYRSAQSPLCIPVILLVPFESVGAGLAMSGAFTRAEGEMDVTLACLDMVSLCTQPPELLDAIVSFIPLPCDLLALSLTNKVLHGIIVPLHLEFRGVCCDARRGTLWRALAARPGLSSRILSLELLDEGPERSRHQLRIPQSFGDDLEPAHEEWGSDSPGGLTAAISRMTALKRFSLRQTIEYLDKYPLDPLFRALCQYCPDLCALEIVFQDVQSVSFDTFSAPLWELVNLTSVSIEVYRGPMFKVVKQKFLVKMFEMLRACPQLQHLRLAREMRGPQADLSGLLADKEWPHLRRLIFEGDLTFRDHPTVVAFLTRHSQLETLSLMDGITLPAMPNLRWLFMPDIVRNVKAANLPRLEHVVTRNVFWLRTLQTLPALRGATIGFQTTFDVAMLVRYLPRLERLVFARAPWNNDRTKRGVEARLPSPECIAVLSSLIHLTHLETAALLPNNAYTDTALDELLRSLSAAPKLQYVGVDFFLEGAYQYLPVVRWFFILRDAQGGYAGWEEVLASLN
ncbi:hypothetical protein DFH06DRAFT_1387860 [Mycena polygramma]|nr:hypothetical protein DFH06DRAFT_1387860 [Mycena polygramma]